MTDEQFDEVHEISKRLDRIIATGKWMLGFVFIAAMAAGGAQISLMSRVASLETSRDNTTESIIRIDRNLEELTRYLRNSAGRP